MANITRRGFIQTGAAAAAAVSGVQLAQQAGVVNAAPANVADNVLIMIYLPGGADFLNLIVPIGGADRTHYETARPTMQIDAANTLSLNSSAFGLHPNAPELHSLFQRPNSPLAFVLAAGSPAHSRSHSEADEFMHSGTPGVNGTTTGWLARHFDSDPNMQTAILMPGASMSERISPSFRGSNEIFTSDHDAYFRSLMMLNGLSQHRNDQRTAIRQIYDLDSSRVHQDGIQALNAANLIELFATNEYVAPAGVTTTYSTSIFNNRLRRAAQLIKLELGLKAITIEMGDWDTHTGQGPTYGSFFNNVGDLSRGLAAFYDDLVHSGGDYADRVTVVVMSEFGRKLRQNNDGGYDHGHGGGMILLGGAVNGGLHGTWPGLHHDALYLGQDLAVTTDYRRVLSEVLIRRMGNPKLGQVFPGYTDYAPLGVVQGVDLPPEYDERTPTAVTLDNTATSAASSKAVTAASIGLAATAGLVALRNRGAD